MSDKSWALNPNKGLRKSSSSPVPSHVTLGPTCAEVAKWPVLCTSLLLKFLGFERRQSIIITITTAV